VTRGILYLMTREIMIGNQILVVTHDGHFHIADISKMLNPLIDKDSIRPALEAYFETHGLRIATAKEAQRSGFPTRETQRDHTVQTPTARKQFHK